MAKGGHREGAGRKKGIPNKSTVEVKDMIDRVGEAVASGDHIGMAAVISKMYARAMGVLAEREGRNGEVVVYEIAPDVLAQKALLEFRFGKPKETVEVQDPDKKFHGLPQVVLVPPVGWGEKR